MTGKMLTRTVRAVKNGSGIRGLLPEITEGAVRLIFSLVLASGRTAGGYSPMAIGFVAAAPPGIMSLVSLAGAVIGYFVSGTGETALKYSGMCILTAAAVFTFRETGVVREKWFRPLAAAVMTLCTGFIYVVEAEFALRSTAAFLCETAAAALGAWAFAETLLPYDAHFSESDDNRKRTALLVSFSMLFASLCGLRLFGIFSVGRFLAAAFVLFASFCGGIPGGAICGAVCGAAADIASGRLFFSVAFAFGGMLAGLARKRGKAAAALIFTGCVFFLALVMQRSDAETGAFFESAAAGAMFFLMPQAADGRIARFFPARQTDGGAIFRSECERQRVLAAADAFAALSSSARRQKEREKNDEDVSSVFDAAAELVCRRCRTSADCWQSGYQDTLRVFNDLTVCLRERGEVTAEDFPAFFASKCERLPELAAAVTDEARAQTLRRRRRALAEESRGAAAGQYADMAGILFSVAEGLGSTSFEPELEERLVCYMRSLDMDAAAAAFREKSGRLRIKLRSPQMKRLMSDRDYLDRLSAVTGVRLCTTEEGAERGNLELFEAEPLSVTVGVSSAHRRGETRSGDRTAYFKTGSGILCALLSDGAGSGEEAFSCASSSSAVLEKLLRADVSPEIAFRLLNAQLLAEGESAAVDLLMLDLFSGNAELYKFGSPPSYAVCARTVSRLEGSVFHAPLGAFPETGAETVRLRLRPGAAVALVSDGVTCGMDDGWLSALISGASDASAQETAKRIVSEASGKFGEDDMTALVICVSERG